MGNMDIDYEEFQFMQPELEVAMALNALIEKSSVEEVADRVEIAEDRILKILALEANPTLGEIKRIAGASGKVLFISFLELQNSTIKGKIGFTKPLFCRK